MFDLAVAGGGIIGLSAALFARRRGLNVVLVDQPRPAQAATPASAGVIWPIEPLPDDSAFWPWVRQGVAAYPEFIASLGADAADKVEFATPGILRLDASATTLLPGEEFVGAGELAHCPELSGGLVAGAARVSPALLRDLLWDACHSAGVVLIPEEVKTSGRDAIWHAGTRRLRSRKKLVATGAWELEGVRLEQPLRPVRGQMLALALEKAWHGPMLQGRAGYLIARAPTRVVLGATVEDVGFDAGITQAGRDELLADNRDILAPLGPFSVVDQWAGLRPCLGDGDRPQIGAVDENLAVALGLYRLGVTTAPAVAAYLAEWAAS